jgi:uncharacterized protein with GYD domain
LRRRASGVASAVRHRRQRTRTLFRLSARPLPVDDPGARARGGRLGAVPFVNAPAANKECAMSTYIGLLNFTDKGIQSVKESPKRAAAAKEMAGRYGVTMKDIYWTLGGYDIVCVLDAPDDASVTAFNLAIAMQGNVRSQTLKAFNAAEVEKVLAKL